GTGWTRMMMGALALSTVLGAGCEQGDDVAANQSPLWAKGDGVATKRTLDVCWTFDGWEHEKQVVQDVIRNSWMKYSEVQVTGWGRCGDITLPGDHDIEIDSDDVPDTRSHSPIGGSYWSHMNLNFVF